MARTKLLSEPDVASTDRVDFVKRLFAITVSVGFANQLARLFPNHTSQNVLDVVAFVQMNWKTLALLASSVFAVVASWEGYLRAVRAYPLRDVSRFYLDIVLVFTYLILFVAVQFYNVWFWVHAVIFALYVVWDILRTRTPEYKNRQPGPWHTNSMVISIIWLCYFIALPLAKHSERTMDFAVAAAAAAFGVVYYRVDKTYRFSFAHKFAAVTLPILLVVIITYYC